VLSLRPRLGQSPWRPPQAQSCWRGLRLRSLGEARRQRAERGSATAGARTIVRRVTEGEVPLLGGNTTEGLVRVGDTVRRPSGPWSASVHDFLCHLNEVG
jgi:hypothetical protein